MRSKMLMVALKLFFVLTLITGLLYPLLITMIGQTFFPYQSNGSLYFYKQRLTGSLLLGQKFGQAKYFWPRPSAKDYNTLPSGASNLSPTSRQLQSEIELRRQKLLKSDPARSAKDIPNDLLYASGSGLDSHISPAAALYQVDRVANARGFNSTKKSEIIKLIDKLTEGRDWDVFGEKRINVLRLNTALDSLP